jgi:hypothetical protein
VKKKIILPETRKAANVMKSKTYLGGPCKKGHNEGRLTSNGDCVVCNRERVSRAYFDSKPICAPEPIEEIPLIIYPPYPTLAKPKRVRRKPGWATIEHP